MNKEFYEDYDCVADEMYDFYADTECSVMYIGGYEAVSAITKFFIMCDPELSFEYFALENPGYDGYKGAYMLTIEDGEIWCEKAVNAKSERDGMLLYAADLIYVEKEYADDAVDACCCPDADFVMVCYGDEEEDNATPAEDEEDKGFHVIYGSDGKPCGWRYADDRYGRDIHMSYTSDKPMTPDEIVRKFNEIIKIYF